MTMAPLLSCPLLPSIIPSLIDRSENSNYLHSSNLPETPESEEEMVAAVVSVIVEDILQRLSSEGIQLGPQWGVERELREIHDLLSSVQGVLPGAENKYGHSLELQDWVRDLKGVAFDAEDLLEELSMEEALRLRDSKLRTLFQPMEKLMFGWRMRGELRAVVRRLGDLLGSDRSSFIRTIIAAGIGDVHEAARAIPLIGREGLKRKLMRLLLDGGRERGIRVIAVEGYCGSGKTALVREVCSEFKFGQRFDVQIWVNASPPFDENRMARQIIASLTNGALPEEEDEVGEQLPHRVAKLFDWRKKYLFVLDNLLVKESESGRWLRFKRFLEGGASGSKILVTTRDSKWINPRGCLNLYIGERSQEDSLALLLKTASKGGGEEEISDPAMLHIATEVIANCYQNPLIIGVVGHYLSLQHAKRDWSLFLDRLHNESLFSLLYGGYPYGCFGAKRYNDLPPRMKDCFGICSLFPRGHAMDRQTLVELWIVLGYIKPSSNEDCRPLEDIADDYFDQLLGKELFRVEKLDIFGKVRSVMMHHHAEDLARSVAGWECGESVMRDFTWLNSELDIGKGEYRRHKSVTNESANFPFHCTWSWLRSLLHFVDDNAKYEGLCNYVIPRLKRTRVLDLHGMDVDAVPEGVWKLKHLRYLDLSDNRRIQTLSPAITCLPNLQTLKLSGCSALKELPRDIREMVALRHLYIDGCWRLSSMPMGLSDLQSLNILTDFILPPDDSSKTVDCADLTDLCKLNDLRGSLRITNLGCSEDEQHTGDGIRELLDKKSSLESLELRFGNLPTDTLSLEKLRRHSNLKGLKIHNYGGIEFPEWMTRLSTHLPNLVEIALIGCENCQHLPLFDQLRHLKLLTIQGMPDLLHMESGSGQSPPDNAQPFGNLSSLCIRDCPKLKSLPMIPRLVKLTLANVSEEIFRHPCRLPSLKRLRLENIELLDRWPEDWLRDLTGLKQLHIGSCPSLVSLSLGMRHLENLESLSIWNCKELDLSKDEQGSIIKELQGLNSLKSLTIYKASKMEYLPEWLSHVSTLRFLCIWSCPRLWTLPKWIGNLQSLELVHCPQFALLPVDMHHSTSSYLKKLTVVGCPLMESPWREEEAEGDRNEKGRVSRRL